MRAKYELICSHTARRSGTTNLYKLGVLSDLELRSITGHESQKNFEGYIRIGISEQAQRVGDKIKAAREAMKKQVLADASGKAERTSRKMLRKFQLSTGLRMKIYTKTNFFLAEIQQKSWISCYF